VPNQGYNWDIHDTVIEDTALRSIDAEDDIAGTGPKVMSLTVDNCIMRRWNWHLTGAPGTGGAFIADAIGLTHDVVDDDFDDYGPITITNNQFLEGAMGYGNPAAEIAVLGSNISDGAFPVIDCPTASRACSFARDVTVSNNVVDLEPGQQGAKSGNLGRRGEFLLIKCATNLTVEGNETNGKGVAHLSSTGTVNVDHSPVYT
jgi:hypothetical protein